MEPNPFLKKLGFSDTDRVVVIHADDIGMSQATLPAITDLFAFGLVSSAAIMVPCPWFQGAAAIAAGNPDVDFGVHLTLNAEWENYRWGPVSTRDPESGLVDLQGNFFRDPEETRARADHGAVRRELDVQLELARKAGVRITHADTHMFCLGTREFLPHYAAAALDANTLPVLMRPNSPGWYKSGFREDERLLQAVQTFETRGIPMMDDVYMMNLDTHEERLQEAMTAFDRLTPGFTHFILHPAADSPELRAMAPDWRCRTADLQVFRDPGLKAHIDHIGVQVIGYETLRRAIPG